MREERKQGSTQEANGRVYIGNRWKSPVLEFETIVRGELVPAA